MFKLNLLGESSFNVSVKYQGSASVEAHRHAICNVPWRIDIYTHFSVDLSDLSEDLGLAIKPWILSGYPSIYPSIDNKLCAHLGIVLCTMYGVCTRRDSTNNTSLFTPYLCFISPFDV